MNNNGSTGIAAIPILTSVLLLGATTSSVFLENQDGLATDAEQILSDVLNEISTYLKIDYTIGKYYTNAGAAKVEKIVISVKQLIQNSINISELKIKIINKDDVVLLSYSGHASKLNSESIFEHSVWDTTHDAFSLIVVIDEDGSLLDYNIMNDDSVFIAIRLPDRFAMADGETITVSIIPASGIIRSVVLETPSFHTSSIISFEEI